MTHSCSTFTRVSSMLHWPHVPQHPLPLLPTISQRKLLPLSSPRSPHPSTPLSEDGTLPYRHRTPTLTLLTSFSPTLHLLDCPHTSTGDGTFSMVTESGYPMGSPSLHLSFPITFAGTSLTGTTGSFPTAHTSPPRAVLLTNPTGCTLISSDLQPVKLLTGHRIP